MKEAVLQAWFEKKARAREIAYNIVNLDELEKRLKALDSAGFHSQSVELHGLRQAQTICDMFSEQKFLFANRDVAPVYFNQMRPDLTLAAYGASYVLIELKTKAAAERQAVQELLAYSMAIKVQQPYVNDFIFVVVAKQWTPLLRYGVKALIQDGKQVLPLEWSQPDKHCSERFDLRIRLDLFNFDITQSYNPLEAMVPCTLAISELVQLWNRPYHPALHQYFERLSHQLAEVCTRQSQAGFVLEWSSRCGFGEEICNLTLVTVNQNWLYSEHSVSDPSDYLPVVPPRLDGKREDLAWAAAELAMPRPVAELEDDVFWSSSRYSEVEEHFPASSYSYDLLMRSRNIGYEAVLKNPHVTGGDFECELVPNLDIFVGMLEEFPEDELWIRRVHPFGEFADFIKGRASPHTATALRQLMVEFGEQKKFRDTAQ